MIYNNHAHAHMDFLANSMIQIAEVGLHPMACICSKNSYLTNSQKRVSIAFLVAINCPDKYCSRMDSRSMEHGSVLCTCLV